MAFLKGGEIYVDLKYVYKNIQLFTNCCWNVWNSVDSNAFLVKLLDILVFCFNRYVDLGKIFKNDLFFSFGQSLKKIIMGQSWVLLYGTKDDVG